MSSTPTVADLVAVKPLEWKDLSDNSGALLVAEAGFGGLEYSLMDYAGGEWNWGTNFVGPSGYLGVQGKCLTLDAAKAAAQADYERRILSRLSPAATEPEPCYWCSNTGLTLNHSGDPTECPRCGGDTVISSPVTVEAAHNRVETLCRELRRRGYLVPVTVMDTALRALAGEKRDD